MTDNNDDHSVLVELKEIVRAQGEMIRLLTDRVRKLELGKEKPEKHYQKLVEGLTGGKHLHIPGVGFTDVSTADAHIEVTLCFNKNGTLRECSASVLGRNSSLSKQ